MSSNLLVYCFVHKKIISCTEWVQHANHHSDLYLVPPTVQGLELVKALLQTDKKNTFHMKEKLMGKNAKHYAVSSYLMTKQEADLMQELCGILYNGVSPHLTRFVDCKFEKISQNSNSGFLITTTEFFDKKLLSNLDSFKPQDLLSMFINICEAIFLLHKKNYFHSNLCIENICLNSLNKPKIVGITNCQRISAPNYEVIYGYTKKMIWPPEFLLGNPLSEKFDVWCLGILLHQIFSKGKYPFPNEKEKYLHQKLRDLSSTEDKAEAFLKIDSSIRQVHDNLAEFIKSKQFLSFLFSYYKKRLP